MRKDSFDFLKTLIETISPSGFEEEAIRLWKKRTKDFCDSVQSDVHGNGIAVLNKKKSLRLMLAGHIDEIGYMVKYIDKEGYIYFSTIGGIDLHLVPGQRVWIKTQKGIVNGVVGKKPIHLLEAEERKRVVGIEQLWIDLGAQTDTAVKEMVRIGDPVVPAVGLTALQNDIVAARGFDDKAGAFVVSETVRLLAAEKCNCAVYGVATVQEEIGLRGAQTSCYGVSPDIGIAIDVAFATDFPGMDKKKSGEIKIGGGPVIARGPNINPKVFEMLVAAACEEKIPYQIQGASGATGTDANAIQLTKAGVATGLVSIPLRYMHTPVELLSLSDIENTAQLLKAFAMRLDKDMSFLPE